jgi:hypothetical protein
MVVNSGLIEGGSLCSGVRSGGIWCLQSAFSLFAQGMWSFIFVIFEF